jgi:hypothetical protein
VIETQAPSSDPLLKVLDAAKLMQDKDTGHSKRDAADFLKSFQVNASTSESKALSLEDGVETIHLLERSLSIEGDLSQEEWDDLAGKMLKLMGDSNWNNNSAAELICQTRQIQEKAAKLRRPDSEDARYGSGLSLTWVDSDTVCLLSASELYLRYYSQFPEQSAKKVAAFMLPYLKGMLRLKMIAEDQDQSAQSKGRKRVRNDKGKPAQTLVGGGNGNSGPGAKGVRAKSLPSVQLGGESDTHHQLKTGKYPQAVIDSAVDWIRRSKGIDSNPQRYYKSLCTMWTSGDFNWARNQPIPSQSQVYYWLKNSRREHPPVVDPIAVSEKQRKLRASSLLKG